MTNTKCKFGAKAFVSIILTVVFLICVFSPFALVKPIWKVKKVFYEEEKQIVEISGGKTLKELLQTIQQTGKLLVCLRTNRAYVLDFVNSPSLSFNAFNVDLETGEIDAYHSNGEVWKDAENKVWSLR